MTATPAAAATHMHPGGIEHYHDIACDRELRLHLFYGHDDGTPATMTAAERHRQAHAGDEAIARGARLAADFNAAGRKIPEGAAVRRGGPSGQSSEGSMPMASRAPSDAPSGQSSEGAVPDGPPAAPSGDRSIYLSDANGAVYLVAPVGWATSAGWAGQLYRLTLEATPAGPLSEPPSGLDPAARMAKAIVEAVRRLDNPEISPAAVETVLAEDLRAALRSYR